MKQSKSQIMGTKIVKGNDYSGCSIDTIFVESVEVKSNLNCKIGGDNGLIYLYKALSHSEVPVLFTTIKVWYVMRTHKDALRRKVIRKWEEVLEPPLKDEELASNETGQTLALDEELDD